MKKLSEADLRFLERFESCQLGAKEFRHREHVRLAYGYLTGNAFGPALKKMEIGLRRLLAHLGAPASKYHQTLTQAWLLAVRHFMHRAGPTKDFDEFLHTGGARLLDKDIIGTHYSPDVLWSEQARDQFVEPDLQQIPRYRT